MPGTNEALADAFSGVVGTLVSLWCFYPIERLKTNVQAGTAPSSLSSSSSSSSSSSRTYDVETIVKLLRQSFRGCGTKSLHATASSFCYFYCYSWILSAYHARRRKGVIDAPQLRPSTGLVLAAIAAMMNTLVTLPLDVLSSQRTVGKEEEEEKSGAAKLGTTARGTKSTTAAATTATATATATTTTTTTTKSTNPADSAEESSSDTQAQAAMAKAWNSIGKREKSTETETENPYRKATTASTSLTSSSSSSSSPESSVVELVFHEACGCSEDLFSLRRDSSGTGSNDDSNNHDHDHDHDPNTSRCSSGGSSHSRLSQNEEYMARWRERQLQRREDRGRRSRQQQQQQQQQQPLRLRLPSDAHNSALRFLRRWSRLWKGLAPALLLCSNPSIHYTVFDVLKTKMLAYKRTNNRNNHRAPKLSVSDAFVLGLLSKFVATIVTYPLIRAKVLMMVRGDDNDDETSSDNDNDNDTERPLRTSTSSSSLVSVLQQSYHRDGGLKGLYKGCDWQLIHTLLKSALMMAIREQITGTSRALFRVPVPVPAAVAVARKNNTVASSSS